MSAPYYKKMLRTSPRQKNPVVELAKFVLHKTANIAKRVITFKRLKKIFIIGIVFTFFLAIFGGITLIGALAYVSRNLPEPDKLIDRQIAQSTKIYDRTGKILLYEIHGDKQRTLIKLEDIPDHAQKAVVALEDRDFYEHGGLSYRRIVKALYSYVMTKFFKRDIDLSGASTLTQQLVKNAILTPERTITRKLKEWILTIQIERKFSKEQILQMYLNEIPYGATAYGIEAASNLYFNKSAKDISLRESAVLAAIIQRPTYYSPYGSRKDLLLSRSDLVLDLMAEQGFVSKESIDQAKTETIVFSEKKENILAPHFVFYIRELLSEKYGEKLVEQGGLEVITTLDYPLQKMAEEIVAAGAERNLKLNATNAALLAMDPKTGEVLTMVGSKDYFDTENDGNVNVTLSLRQPGSSIKPVVYAAAFEKGYTPDTILYDVETDFPTQSQMYHPRNYNLKEHGPVSMRKALQGSLNIPAVKTLYLAGVTYALDFAEKLGYTSFKDRSRFGLALVLGGGEVQLIEHVAAFGVFANDGVQSKKTAILRITNSSGKVLEEKIPEQKQVIDKNIARTVSNVLSDNESRAYIFGRNSALQLGNRPVAVKTGTTNSYRDGWTIGYTPSLVAGVWVGNNDNTAMQFGADSSKTAAPMWNEFMRKALEGKAIESFIAPAPHGATKPVLAGKEAEEKEIVIDTISGKLATEFTPDSTRKKVIYKEAHNILHYVYKDSPRGEYPKDPVKADFMYKFWEESLQKWIAKNNEQCTAKQTVVNEFNLVSADTAPCVFYNIPIPTEFDDVHTRENQPAVIILSPFDQEVITSSTLSAHIQILSTQSIESVKYFLDDTHITTTTVAPYDLSYPLSENLIGFHTLKVRVTDVLKNSVQNQVLINYRKENVPLSIQWISPTSGQSISMSQFPITLHAKLSTRDNVKLVSIDSSGPNGQNLIGTLFTPPVVDVFIPWTTPSLPGTYTLNATVQGDFTSVVSDPLVIEIIP